MKFTIPALCAALAVSVAAQETPQGTSSAAWLDFLQSQGAAAPQWQAEWSKVHGTPSAVWGPGIRVAEGRVDDVVTARTLAERFLVDHADLFGRGASTYVERVGQKVGKVWIFVYDQQFRGLPVIDARADVRLHEVGRVPMFGSRTLDVPADFSTMPRVAPEVAAAVANRENDGDRLVEKPTLVIWGNSGAPRLAWEVVVANDEPLVSGRSYVDALTGRQLEWKNDVYQCSFGHRHGRFAGAVGRGHLGRAIAEARETREARKAAAADGSTDAMMSLDGNVSAWVMTQESGLASPQLTPMPRIDVVATGLGTFQTDAQGDFSIPYSGSNPVSVTVRLRGDHISDVTTNVGSAMVLTQQVAPGTPAQFTFGSAGSNEFERAQMNAYWWTDRTNVFFRGIVGNTPQLATADNITAETNIPNNCNAFYTRNTTNYFVAGNGCTNTSFASVIAHEWGHGIDERYGGISQTGGLSEAWGDIISMYLLDSPVIGLGFRTNGGGIRDGRNTRTRPNGGFPSGGAPHPKGEVFMGYSWSVREALIQAMGQQMGADYANQIVLGSLPADATDQPGAVREIFVLDDDDGNLANGVPNYAILSQFAIQRNIPYPEVQLGTINHAALTSVDQPLTAQVVRATANAINGTFTRVDLAFSVDGGQEQRREMVNTSGSEFVALLPGVPSPQSVRYYFEAQHSGGGSVRVPENGGFEYTVGDRTVFFADDFENGPNGWTSSQLAGPVRNGSNDWMQGTPNGSAGDPPSAYQGQNVWGNDLAPSGFNGAYQDGISNQLESPAIDLSGQTNVRVRFARWLTVESGQYDQADFLANNLLVWRNPLQNDLIDTSWQVVEYAVPSPTAATRFQFRLTSDASVNFGGWNVDDFEVFSFAQIASPPVAFTLDNEMIAQATPSTATISGTPNAPAVLLISASEGPTQVVGLNLAVGPFAAFGFALDSAGQATFPVGAGNVGDLVYSQVVELSGGQLQVSNPQRVLFGN